VKQNALPEQTLPYGDKTISFTLPEGQCIGRLEPLTPEPSRPPKEMLARALANPIGSPRLREIAAGRKSASILIPGKTRVAATQYYVPALIYELNAAGIPDEKIEVFLATGTHELHLESDVAGLLGEEAAQRVRCFAHDCHDESSLVSLGTTERGTPVLFNRRVLDTEVKILTGRLVPHYFAGFSGGRKALLPGVAGFATVLANHKLTLDPHRGIHPDVAPCSLARNPVHLDMMEAAAMTKPDFCLNTILDTKRRLVDVVCGDWVTAHELICARAYCMLRVTVAEPVDVVITSAGGAPSDCNFMQSLKAVFDIQDIVRPGGAILWVAECPFGIQPGFLEWGAIESDEELEIAVREKYALTGHNSLMLRRLIRRADVALLSALPPEQVKRMGLHPVSSIEEGLQWIRHRFPHGFTYAVVPYANGMYATIENGVS